MEHYELEFYAFRELISANNPVILTTQCLAKGEIVIDGEALIKVHSRTQ